MNKSAIPIQEKATESSSTYADCDENVCVNGKCSRTIVNDNYSPICKCFPGYYGHYCQYESFPMSSKSDEQRWNDVYILQLFGVTFALTVILISLLAFTYFVVFKKQIDWRSLLDVCSCTRVKSWMKSTRMFFKLIRINYIDPLLSPGAYNDRVAIQRTDSPPDLESSPITPPPVKREGRVLTRRLSRDYDSVCRNPDGTTDSKKVTFHPAVTKERLANCFEEVEI